MFDGDTLYFHIGLMYLNPYRPTFCVLEDKFGGGAAGQELVALTAKNEYVCFAEAFSQLCLSDSWTAYFYELDNSVRPIPSMVPGEVACKLLCGPFGAWPLPAGEAGDVDLDEWDEVDDEDRESDDGTKDPLLALLDESAEAIAGDVPSGGEGEEPEAEDVPSGGEGDAGHDDAVLFDGDEADVDPPPPLLCLLFLRLLRRHDEGERS